MEEEGTFREISDISSQNCSCSWDCVHVLTQGLPLGAVSQGCLWDIDPDLDLGVPPDPGVVWEAVV